MIVVFFFENKFGCGFCKVTSKSDAKAITKNVDDCSIGCSVSYSRIRNPSAIDGDSIEPLSVLHSKLKFDW